MTTIIACPLLLAAGFFDLKKKIIPNWILLCLLVLGLTGVVTGTSMHFLGALDGLLCVSLPLGIIWLVSAGKLIGAGDVKLAAVLGLLFGSYVNLIGLLIAVFAALAYIIISFLRNRRFVSEFSFGFFLISGVFIAFLVLLMA